MSADLSNLQNIKQTTLPTGATSSAGQPSTVPAQEQSGKAAIEEFTALNLKKANQDILAFINLLHADTKKKDKLNDEKVKADIKHFRESSPGAYAKLEQHLKNMGVAVPQGIANYLQEVQCQYNENNPNSPLTDIANILSLLQSTPLSEKLNNALMQVDLEIIAHAYGVDPTTLRDPVTAKAALAAKVAYDFIKDKVVENSSGETWPPEVESYLDEITKQYNLDNPNHKLSKLAVLLLLSMDSPPHSMESAQMQVDAKMLASEYPGVNPDKLKDPQEYQTFTALAKQKGMWSKETDDYVKKLTDQYNKTHPNHPLSELEVTLLAAETPPPEAIQTAQDQVELEALATQFGIDPNKLDDPAETRKFQAMMTSVVGSDQSSETFQSFREVANLLSPPVSTLTLMLLLFKMHQSDKVAEALAASTQLQVRVAEGLSQVKKMRDAKDAAYQAGMAQAGIQMGMGAFTALASLKQMSDLNSLKTTMNATNEAGKDVNTVKLNSTEPTNIKSAQSPTGKASLGGKSGSSVNSKVNSGKPEAKPITINNKTDSNAKVVPTDEQNVNSKKSSDVDDGIKKTNANTKQTAEEQTAQQKDRLHNLDLERITNHRHLADAFGRVCEAASSMGKVKFEADEKEASAEAKEWELRGANTQGEMDRRVQNKTSAKETAEGAAQTAKAVMQLELESQMAAVKNF